MPTKNSEAFIKALGPSCKKCGKGTYTGPDSKPHHEKRADPTVTGGRRADPNAKKPKQPADEEPDRTHPLDRKLWGEKK